MDAEMMIKAAQNAGQQQQGIAPGVLPQPVPISVQLMTAQGNAGEKWVVLVIATPVGQNVFHLEPDGAEKIADGMRDVARLARTGLEIPSGAMQ